MTGFEVFDIQKTARRILHSATAQDRLAQAYLFYGPEGTGKWAAAVRTAQLIMCPDAWDDRHNDCPVCRRIAGYNHPDVHWIIPLSARDKQKTPGNSTDTTGKSSVAQDEEQEGIFDAKREDPWALFSYPRRPYITMPRIRALQSILSRTPVEGPRKVGILVNCETMRQDAQSVLLKTIEEPPPDSYIILTTSGKSMLLPTIISRCQSVRFSPLPKELIFRRLIDETGLDEEKARRVAELSGGGWTRAQRLASEEWDLWYQAALTLFAKTTSGSAEDLALAVDTVFKQRLDLDKILFFFEVWQIMLHRTIILPAQARTSGVRAVSADIPPAIFRSRAILDDARAAVIGNVTPKTAVAAALLELQHLLQPAAQRPTVGKTSANSDNLCSAAYGADSPLNR